MSITKKKFKLDILDVKFGINTHVNGNSHWTFDLTVNANDYTNYIYDKVYFDVHCSDKSALPREIRFGMNMFLPYGMPSHDHNLLNIRQSEHINGERVEKSLKNREVYICLCL